MSVRDPLCVTAGTANLSSPSEDSVKDESLNLSKSNVNATGLSKSAVIKQRNGKVAYEPENHDPGSWQERPPLFDEVPDASIPGNVHLIPDESLRRLIESNGAISLLRQMAKDLAERDSQVTELRKRFEDREKKLKNMLFESGVSRIDVERRLANVVVRRPSRESVLSGRPRSEFSYVETLDDQLQDAMSEVDAVHASPQSKQDNLGSSTPRATQIKHSPRAQSKQGSFLSGSLQSRSGSVETKHRRRASALSRWSAGLFGWDRDPRANQTSGQNSIGNDTTSDDKIAFDDSVAAGQHEEISTPGSSQRVSATQSAGKLEYLNSRLWPDGCEPLHFLAIRKAQTSKPADLDDPTAGGWLNRRNVSSSIAALTYSLVFDRYVDQADAGALDHKGPAAGTTTDTERSNQIPKVSEDIHSHLHSLSTQRANDSWISPAIREKAQAVLPSSSTNRSTLPQNLTMELETFIPDVEQPPTMLPAWNYDHSLERGQVLTDRFGFRLFDARKKQREVNDQICAALEIATHSPGDKSASSEQVSLISRSVSKANSLASPVANSFDSPELEITPDLDNVNSVNFDAHSNESGPSLQYRRDLQKSAVSPRPLVPETTLNKSGAIFSNEKSSARLLMLSQLDLYGAEKAKQENWDAFLRKTRDDRRKVGSPDSGWIDQNENELIGLAGLGTGKMAKERWKELNTLVLSGIPMSYRPKIWGEMTGAHTMKEPLYYQELIEHGKDEDDQCVNQIDLDIKRTMPSNVFFAGTGPGVTKLRRVLLASSRHNPDVGYCQGMNVIAATLLLTHPTEEDAFFVLTCIMEKILPERYFTPDLLRSRADQIVLKQIVQELCPKVHKHLATLCVDLEAITFGWFLSVFTDCLPAELLFRTWDIFFMEGHPYLFCVAIAIIKVQEKALILCDSPGQVYTLLKELTRTREMNIDEFVKIMEQSRATIRSKGFDIRKMQSAAVNRILPAGERGSLE